MSSLRNWFTMGWARGLGLLFVAVVVFTAISHDAEAARRRRSHPRGGHGGGGSSSACGQCSSGYGLVAPSGCGAPANSPVQRFYTEHKAEMLSCCRPQDGQNRLIACYERCTPGQCCQPGRAARSSTHTRGQACDSPTGNGRPYGLSLLFHHGSRHWSTTGH
jgi:hypothetical protein